jgi:nucleoside-diphosphate-sugar epimerase
MMRCAVTGSTGFVGRQLCKELVDAGHEVTAIHRASSDVEELKSLGVKLREGNVKDAAALQQAFAGADVVFHIAALFREAKHGDDEYRAVNVGGTKNVLDSAVACNVKKVVHCSTVGVHSHIPNPPADETEAYRPGDIYQETKCEGEKVALEYFRSGRIPGCVIRPAMIWGPGDSRTRKLFRGIQKRSMPIIGTGKTLLHWVDVRDLARGFRLAAEKPVGSGEVYILAGEKPVEVQELFGLIAERVGASLLPFKVPASPVQIAGDIVEAICKPMGIEPPIYRRRVDFFTKTRAFDWSKARAELGYSPAGHVEDEIRDIVQSYRDLSWLD